jgi:putative uncharacterized protein (fragment)
MGEQEIRSISLKDLVLWSENPRDPIEARENSVIIKQALKEPNKGRKGEKVWDLMSLIKKMGKRYDQSELPTVVYKDEKPIVYDGNRRIILAKIKHEIDLADLEDDLVDPYRRALEEVDIPSTLPCNVCLEDIALEFIERKHADSGTWRPLERDWFMYRYRGKEKSLFILFDEQLGGRIRRNGSPLNQRFVKDEVITEENLSQMGILRENDKLFSRHSQEELEIILDDLESAVEGSRITTRENRGKVFKALSVEVKRTIEKNKDREPIAIGADLAVGNSENNGVTTSQMEVEGGQTKRTRRVREEKPPLFGKSLELEVGVINNFYRDIEWLDVLWKKRSTGNDKGVTLPYIIRLSLRLLYEAAVSKSGLEDSGKKKKEEVYIDKFFDKANKLLTKEERTKLRNLSVKKETLWALLNAGAHYYTTSPDNYAQTEAIALLLGAILSVSDGKKK